MNASDSESLPLLTPRPLIAERADVNVIGRAFRKILRSVGFEFRRVAGQDIEAKWPIDFDVADHVAIEAVQPFTMTSRERLYGLRRSVEYIVKHQIPGAIVECGTWRGGSMMVVALTLLENRCWDRDLYLFDTFEGMPAPTDVDTDYAGISARTLLDGPSRSEIVAAVADIETVRKNMFTTGYPRDRIHLCRGMVENTLPTHAPSQIALLRLDTDWYESTRHELAVLVPRMAPNAVVILDDYGHWAGARRAIDEWIEQMDVPILLNRLDYTGRLAIIPAHTANQ